MNDAEENQISALKSNVENYCRICGLTTSLNTILKPMMIKIEKYLPIDILYQNTLPAPLLKICDGCVNIIKSWDIFFKKCLKFDKKLKIIVLSKLEANDDKDNSSSFLEVNHEKNNSSKNEVEEDQNTYIKIFHCDVCNKKQLIDNFLSHMTTHALESTSLINQENDKNNQEDIKDNQQYNNDETDNALNESVIQVNNENNSNSSHSPSSSTKVKCIECKKLFKNLQSMKSHLRTTHRNKKEVIKCNYCEKEFSNLRLQKNHINSIHLNLRNFNCNKCNKSFKTDSTLYSHMRIHENKKFVCENCGKKFNYKHQLKNHLNVIHGGSNLLDSNYICKVCKKKFLTANNLSKHMKIHVHTLDHACRICGFKTKLKRYLHEHMKKHHLAVFKTKK